MGVCFPPPHLNCPPSADGKWLQLVFAPLIFFEQLNAVVTVELDGSPVTVVVDQQGALLQAALTVCFGRDTELCDILGKVLLDCCSFRL